MPPNRGSSRAQMWESFERKKRELAQQPGALNGIGQAKIDAMKRQKQAMDAETGLVKARTNAILAQQKSQELDNKMAEIAMQEQQMASALGGNVGGGVIQEWEGHNGPPAGPPTVFFGGPGQGAAYGPLGDLPLPSHPGTAPVGPPMPLPGDEFLPQGMDELVRMASQGNYDFNAGNYDREAADALYQALGQKLWAPGMTEEMDEFAEPYKAQIEEDLERVGEQRMDMLLAGGDSKFARDRAMAAITQDNMLGRIDRQTDANRKRKEDEAEIRKTEREEEMTRRLGMSREQAGQNLETKELWDRITRLRDTIEDPFAGETRMNEAKTALGKTMDRWHAVVGTLKAGEKPESEDPVLARLRDIAARDRWAGKIQDSGANQYLPGPLQPGVSQDDQSFWRTNADKYSDEQLFEGL